MQKPALEQQKWSYVQREILLLLDGGSVSTAKLRDEFRKEIIESLQIAGVVEEVGSKYSRVYSLTPKGKQSVEMWRAR